MKYCCQKLFGLNINVNKNKLGSSERYKSDRYIDFIISHHINYNTIIFKPIVNIDTYTLHAQINHNISPTLNFKVTESFISKIYIKTIQKIIKDISKLNQHVCDEIFDLIKSYFDIGDIYIFEKIYKILVKKMLHP